MFGFIMMKNGSVSNWAVGKMVSYSSVEWLDDVDWLCTTLRKSVGSSDLPSKNHQNQYQEPQAHSESPMAKNQSKDSLICLVSKSRPGQPNKRVIVGLSLGHCWVIVGSS